MDHAEWQAAYRRATMDSSTMRDMIKDLQIEREQLRAQLRDLRALIRALEMERDNWQRLAVNNG